jgi:hypothetical protein
MLRRRVAGGRLTYLRLLILLRLLRTRRAVPPPVMRVARRQPATPVAQPPITARRQAVPAMDRPPAVRMAEPQQRPPDTAQRPPIAGPPRQIPEATRPLPLREQAGAAQPEARDRVAPPVPDRVLQTPAHTAERVAVQHPLEATKLMLPTAALCVLVPTARAPMCMTPGAVWIFIMD